MRQLLDVQEYPVTKVNIIMKGFYCEADVEKCVAYLHGLYQLPGYTRYTSYTITLCTCLQILLIDNNTMLAATKFIVDL